MEENQMLNYLIYFHYLEISGIWTSYQEAKYKLSG